MSGPASHFIVDMWTSNAINKVLGGANDDNKPKSAKSGYTAPFVVPQTMEQEAAISLIGPTMWSSEWESYYHEPVRPQNASDVVAPSATKRRANNFTISGRPAASILYQELSKVNVDAHRLVEPYDYGEQLGPAESLSQPFKIDVHPQVGLLCDIHGHLCEAEVIGLLAGKWDAPNKRLYIQAPFPCAATERHEDFGFTDVELDPEAEWQVRQAIAALGLEVVGWYHSHPKFKPNPSVMDIFNQQQYQLYTRDESTGEEPFVGLIVSTYDAQLSTPASDHQWFTVVPYAPPVRRNSVIEEDVNDEKPRKEETQDMIHMPVRMAVTYRTVDLKAAFSAETCGTVCSGVVGNTKIYSEPLMKSLMALQLQDASSVAPTSKNTSASSSSKQASSTSSSASGVKLEDESSSAAAAAATTGIAEAPAKRKYTPRKPKVPVEGQSGVSSKSEGVRNTLSAQALAVHNNPVSEAQSSSTKPVVPTTVAKLSKATKGGRSKSSNSLKSSLEDGEVRESSANDAEAAIPSTSSANSLGMNTPPAVSDEDMLEGLQAQIDKYDKSEEDNSYWRSLPTPPEITPSTSTGAIAGILGMHIENSASSEQVSDAEVARRLIAEEEAQGTGRARRATRDTKKNDRFGDFVDTLEVTKNLRRQNMENVKATELKQKQKAAADRVKLKAPVMVVVPVLKDTPEKAGAKKQKVAEGRKGKNEPCDDCAPAFNLADSTLCGTVVLKKKAPVPNKPEKEAASVYTSIILALQDPERPSAALAREMLCAVVPSYRGLVLLVASMGFYYARSPRRVDLSRGWKGMARVEKIKASAAVWLQRLGLSPDPTPPAGAAPAVASSVNCVNSATSDSEAGADASSTEDNSSDAKEGDTTKDSTALSTRNSSSAKLCPENVTYQLNEWVGKFLTACWEDYSKVQNRKRKA